MQDVWVEKYRPKRLADVIGQKGIVERLSAYVRTRSMPHMLFAGPAGSGKTTSAIALARELYGEQWRDSLIELNASDERGIDIVRGKIKDFARAASIGTSDFKIIFLDEADSLTSDAQAALRRTMERYTQTCRFI
ncbi:MAG: AAA family ATPase, partial [Thermoplasmata archaeon]|nr:AAA family ATPase [Thermoplasmata archaeon]